MTPGQVAEFNAAEDSRERVGRLVEELPSSQRNLLAWAVDLMTDVAEYESLNKMNAHNIATVFAPNMSHVRTKEGGRERGAVAVVDSFFAVISRPFNGRTCHS